MLQKSHGSKATQHRAADALFRAIIEALDKHRNDRTLTGRVLDDLARVYVSISTNVPDQGGQG
ncbi:hypothetical protein MUBE_02510 [Mycobacterium uberis]|uniref:Uncharacterized protein n=1 Tax=Mycobacterium uberis TaxID=2162698 RepID=A0A3E1HJS6_9MYCO|nr:hypothetical protein MUBE_02510 [Mycobacterium uberis]